jgi:hypothetical protein
VDHGTDTKPAIHRGHRSLFAHLSPFRFMARAR